MWVEQAISGQRTIAVGQFMPPGFAIALGGPCEYVETARPALTWRIVIGAVILGVFGLITYIGVTAPGMGWPIYLLLMPLWEMFPIIVVGVEGALICLGLHVVGYPIARWIVSQRPGYAQANAELARTGRTTYGGLEIGSGGRSSGGSSSRGGGFSGGGGRSGGGGASGSW